MQERKSASTAAFARGRKAKAVRVAGGSETGVFDIFTEKANIGSTSTRPISKATHAGAARGQTIGQRFFKELDRVMQRAESPTGPNRRGWWRVAASVAVAALVAACDSPDHRATRHYERGMAFVEQGADTTATLEFRNALRLNSDHVAARYQLGMIALRGGDHASAVQNFRAVAELDPTHLAARVELGTVLVMAGDLEVARTVLDEAAEIDPQKASVAAALGMLELAAGDTAAAHAQASRALGLDPGNTVANATLVRLRHQAGDDEAALAMLDALIAEAPGEIAYDRLKMEIVLLRNDAAAGRRQLERMVALYPEEVRYRQLLAQLLVRTGDHEAAEAHLRALVAGAPDRLSFVMDLVAFRLATAGERAEREELTARIDAASPAIRDELRLALARRNHATGRLAEARETLEALLTETTTPTIRSDARSTLADVLLHDDPVRAAELVEAVLAEDRGHVGALSVRARLALAAYRPADAITDIRVALNTAPDTVSLLLLEALAHERQGNLVLAGESLAAATRASGHALSIARRHAQFLHDRGDAMGAEAVIETVTRQHPDDADAHALLAELRLRRGDWAGAERAAEAVLRLGGDDAMAERVIAATLTAQGRLEDGTGRLLTLVERGHTRHDTMTALLRNFVRLGQTERAVTLVETMLAETPDNPVARLAQADLLMHAGDIESARALLAQARQPHAETPTFSAALARLELAAGNGEAAKAVLHQSLERFPQDEGLLFLLAQTYGALREHQQAIAIYEILYGRNPGSLIFANNLASLIAQHRADDPNAIARAAQIAQRLRGHDNPHLRDTYGWVLFLKGDKTAALPHLIAAAEGLPQNPYVRYHLGRVYAALDEFDLARNHLEAALAIDAGFASAASARGTLAALSPR